MSTIIDIADGVALELNSSGLLGSAAAVRYYKPVFDLQDMKSLHVSVVPRAVEMLPASRAVMQTDVQIDIGVQKKLASEAELDGLMQLTERIGDHLRGRRIAGAAWAGAENAPIFSVEHLEQLRQFTSVLTITYRVLR